MINCKELRTGNKIIANGVYQGAVKTFERFNDKLTVVFFSDGSETGIGEFLKDCLPIPFTTEWAQRFNLIGRIINGLCISESEYQGHEYDLCLYDEHTWDSERRVICPIYYVHQCQNILLDLAGHIIE